MSFNLEGRLKKAQKAFAARHYLEAKELFGQVLEKFPRNMRAKKGYLLSQSAFADANFSSTHPAMKELDDIARALSLGEAEAAARRAYALAPKFSDAHGLFNLLGVSAAATRREEDAVKAFKRAIYLKPDFMEARANLASRMMAGSDFETALRVIEESLELAHGDALALNAMTVCLTGLKRFEDALESGHKAVAARPDNAEAHNNLGICFRRLEKWREAADCFARALEINPQFDEALNNLGLVQVKRGNIPEGIRLYEQCLA